MKKAIIITIVLIFIGVLTMRSATDRLERAFYPLKHVTLIKTYSSKYEIDPYLVAAIIYEESRFKENSVSKAGAVGLMQIMPNTADWISKKNSVEFDHQGSLTSPKKNIAMGTWYFNWLYEKYDSETLALAAYNGGYKNLDDWLSDSEQLTDEDFIEEIPFEETKSYVKQVNKSRKRYEQLYPGAF